MTTSTITTTRFLTLMQREWMQHRLGWIIVMAILPLLFLGALPFGETHFPPHLSPSEIAMVSVAGGMFSVGFLTWSVLMFQLPGLARRDQQDRSIEFWMSLPASHTESVSATLLMHALLIPMAAVAVGLVTGLVAAAGLLFKAQGAAALLQVSWGSMLMVGLIGLLRLSFGILLLTLWLAPLFMLLMAASAWLKRAGVAAALAAVGLVGLVLDKAYGNPIVWKLLAAQTDGALHALFDAADRLKMLKNGPGDLEHFIEQFGPWAAQDAWLAVQQLASPHLIGGLVLAAAGFSLVILNRRRAT